MKKFICSFLFLICIIFAEGQSKQQVIDRFNQLLEKVNDKDYTYDGIIKSDWRIIEQRISEEEVFSSHYEKSWNKTQKEWNTDIQWDKLRKFETLPRNSSKYIEIELFFDKDFNEESGENPKGSTANRKRTSGLMSLIFLYDDRDEVDGLLNKFKGFFIKSEAQLLTELQLLLDKAKLKMHRDTISRKVYLIEDQKIGKHSLSIFLREIGSDGKADGPQYIQYTHLAWFDHMTKGYKYKPNLSDVGRLMYLFSWLSEADKAVTYKGAKTTSETNKVELYMLYDDIDKFVALMNELKKWE